ncbi:thiol-disulfide oxidoreductase ResA [Hazenella sp. IB182357]|uniref:Thiol-disulfide oxidoreductase ResA n=1 Tax=Polycladospora coralii TaxID=2771432 RepID=A0A926RTK6_9BACL|nr:thiol-disulfide oxidoreductase ResA [Polycladospora coralii]MBD1371294.1 thiol-disulfide oxidoreductase ResA [Polycladospora coralii]MBS7530255.1 thiol-disulfide oxidoreductase ResA [Polycladospora coralii]
MNKQTRYWVRRILFGIMIGMIAFTLYRILTEDQAKVDVGDQAPDFTLQTLDGNQVKLSELKGKAVMLNFWGTWCKPCREEMPAMQDAYNKYHKLGFEIVAINVGETEVAVQQFVDQYKLSFPTVLDEEKEVQRQYDVGPLPSSFFISSEGVIVNKIEGALDLQRLEYYVTQILPQK